MSQDFTENELAFSTDENISSLCSIKLSTCVCRYASSAISIEPFEIAVLRWPTYMSCRFVVWKSEAVVC